jgi:hypothetical protein
MTGLLYYAHNAPTMQGMISYALEDGELRYTPYSVFFNWRDEFNLMPPSEKKTVIRAKIALIEGKYYLVIYLIDFPRNFIRVLDIVTDIVSKASEKSGIKFNYVFDSCGNQLLECLN